jgi:hypothetical protein
MYLPSSRSPEILNDFLIFSSMVFNCSGNNFFERLLKRLIIGKTLIIPVKARHKIMEADTKLMKTDVNPIPNKNPSDIAIYDKGNVCSSILNNK